MTRKKKFIPKSKKQRRKKTSGGNGQLDDKIIKYLNSKSRSGTKGEIVYNHFIKRFSDEKIEASVKRLVKNKKIEITDNGKIKAIKFIPLDDKYLIGTLDMAASGVGFVKVENFDKDIFIPRKNILNALNNDIVKIELTSFKKSKPEGKVVEVLERNQSEFLGKFEKNAKFGFVIPLDKAVTFDIYIPEVYYDKAQDGDIVRVEVKTWKDMGKNPIGKITEILNDFNQNEIEMQSIILESGFRLNFNNQIDEELLKLRSKITKAEIDRRIDYRNVTTLTIDPKDAKDFDDALSVQKLENGNHEVGVHIADVSHYVKIDSALDKEAQYRATSVYLPDRVVPMLPERISNDLCSLRPHEDKLAFSVFFEFDEKHKIVSYAFKKTVIHSDKRFIYNQVQEIIDGKDSPFKEEILYLTEVARSLRKKRNENGSINFESDEVRFVLDEESKPVDVYIKERIEANDLVEDFMLLANTSVAKFLGKLSAGKKRGAPSVYRVHDNPSEEKLAILGNIAKRFGYNLNFADKEKTRDILQSLMIQLENKPEMNILSTLAIRSMAKAVYTTKNIGHFGLAFEHYTHFTSPIRRYPDVLTHRLLASKINVEKVFYDKEELEELLVHSSMMEKKAQKAERSATKFKQVEYISKYVGEEFEGIISGVINKGIFVELVENKCEGFVPLFQLSEEFVFEEELMRLRGLKTGTIYQIGETIQVVVEEANLADKRIEFSIVE